VVQWCQLLHSEGLYLAIMWDHFSTLLQVLLDAGYVIEPACNTQGNTLRESGRRFFDEKYRDHFDNIFSAIGNWFKAMGEDPLNVRFGDDWGRLTRDLLFDSEGSLKFKTDLWSDIRKVILPTIVDKVSFLSHPLLMDLTPLLDRSHSHTQD